MTLYEITHLLEGVAKEQPSVNMIVRNDPYKLNGYNDAKYGVFSYVQGQHRLSVDYNHYAFAFTLYYIDMETATGDNATEVQSVGIDTISAVIRRMADLDNIYIGDVTFQPFYEKFLDQCAGVFANVVFEVPRNAGCPEFFPEYNEDYNNDFLII